MESSRLSRRGMLQAGGIMGAGALAGTALGVLPAHAESPAAVAVRPPMLRPGDRVRVVSPGSTPDPVKMARGIEILQSWGLVVEVAPHVFDRFGYLAGTDADRLADLNAAFADPSVAAVFAARGGYGTQRIIDGLDVKAARKRPKVVVGFSDITSLQGRLWRDARLVTFYGPMVNWTDSRTGPESIESLRRAVMTTEPIVVNRNPDESTAPVVVPGRASGVLLGGTLTMVESSIDAGDFPDLTGAILFFEEVDEKPYRIDRMLTHMLRAGTLKRIAGVAVGQIVNSVGGPGEWDANAVILDRLRGLGVPVLGGLPLGHGNGQLTIPLGATATIDTAAGTLTVEPGVRAA